MSAGSTAISEARPGRAGRLVSRLVRSRPSMLTAAIGAILWASAMGASLLFGLDQLGWQTQERIYGLLMLYVAGGALAFPLGLWAAAAVSEHISPEARFAAGFLCLSATTIAVTGIMFALFYRAYYAEWHGEPGSLLWMFQFVFTTLAALYQFAVLGVRLYFPVGFLALLAASLWITCRAR